ncbi:OsmC family protein [Hahella sp. SMD15-11]|uniref:OsmC family protein n=1 Tax=Thermohahella caldifontis TaxID=3142973 RepID=A0AB39UTP0_9GAMM
MSEKVKVILEQVDGYEFRVKFPDTPIPDLTTDEGAPLGQFKGPSPERMLATAAGNCLAASLLFANQKFKNQAYPIRAEVDVTIGRNESNRLRIQKLDVKLTVGNSKANLNHLDRILEQFEDFCTVTASIRQGIRVDVSVFDRDGAKLK